MGHRLALCIMTAGALLRLNGLTCPTLCFGELCSWEIVRRPWVDAIHVVAADLHPPLYFLTLKVWVSICGDSVFSMRALSVALDAASIYAIYRFGANLFRRDFGAGSEHLGLVAAAIWAFCAFEIVHAREVRMYALGGLLAVLSSLALWRALWNPAGRLGSWAAYVATATGLAYTHNYGLFTVATQGFFALLVSARHHLWRASIGPIAPAREVLTAFALIFAAYSPWLPVLFRQRASVIESCWIPELGLSEVVGSIEQVLTAFDNIHPMPMLSGLGATAIGVMLVALLVKPSWADVYLFLLSASPLALALAVSIGQGRNILVGKYLAFGVPFWIAAAGRLALRFPAGAPRAGIVMLLLGNLAAQSFMDLGADSTRQHGVRAAIRTIATRYRQGDLVFSLDPGVQLAARYYLPRFVRPLCIADAGRLKRNQGDAVFDNSDYVYLKDIRCVGKARAWLLGSSVSSSKLHLMIAGSTSLYSDVMPDAAPQYGAAYLKLFEIDQRTHQERRSQP